MLNQNWFMDSRFKMIREDMCEQIFHDSVSENVYRCYENEQGRIVIEQYETKEEQNELLDDLLDDLLQGGDDK